MRCSWCKISQKQNRLILSLYMLRPATLDPSCEGCCSHFCSALRARLPGGYLFRDIQPYLWDFRHGPLVSILRLLYPLSRYCLGGRLAMKKRPIGELASPYPTLYHFTPESNRNSILEHGLLPSSGRVFLTNWQDIRWVENFRKWKKSDVIICFQIDAERLAEAGHRIAIFSVFHEYYTDYVPPDCLILTDMRIVGTVSDQ